MFNYFVELDGNHYSGFLCDSLKTFKHSHNIRQKNPPNLSHFNLYNASFCARLLIASSQNISYLDDQVGHRDSLILFKKTFQFQT